MSATTHGEFIQGVQERKHLGFVFNPQDYQNDKLLRGLRLFYIDFICNNGYITLCLPKAPGVKAACQRQPIQSTVQEEGRGTDVGEEMKE